MEKKEESEKLEDFADLSKKNYIIAVKSGKELSLPQNWLDEIGEINGVQVRSGTSDQCVVKADEKGIKIIRERFPNEFLIEEEVKRNF